MWTANVKTQKTKWIIVVLVLALLIGLEGWQLYRLHHQRMVLPMPHTRSEFKSLPYTG